MNSPAARIRFLVCRALVLLALLWSAAGTGTVSHAQDTSLLLGYRFAEPIPRPLPYYAGSADSLSRPAYRTVLVSNQNGEVTIRGEAPGLLVPRNGAIWRVDTKRSVYNNWVEDFIWSVPDGGVPRYPGIQVYNGEYCDGHRTQTVHFAGADYLALEIRSAGYCEDAAHPWFFNTFAVVPIDSTTHLGVPVSQLFGEAGRSALNAAAEAYLDGLTEEERFDYVQEPDEASWNLTREQGRWVVKGRLDPSAVSILNTADFDVDVQIPAALVRRNQLLPDWGKVRAFAPDAVDAFSSPSGDLLVILHPAQLTVHAVESGRIGPAVLTSKIPQGATAVMTRWAVGPAAARWRTHFAQTPRSAVILTH